MWYTPLKGGNLMVDLSNDAIRILSRIRKVPFPIHHNGQLVPEMDMVIELSSAGFVTYWPLKDNGSFVDDSKAHITRAGIAYLDTLRRNRKTSRRSVWLLIITHFLAFGLGLLLNYITHIYGWS
jgi:hypothetical protein